MLVAQLTATCIRCDKNCQTRGRNEDAENPGLRNDASEKDGVENLSYFLSHQYG